MLVYLAEFSLSLIDFHNPESCSNLILANIFFINAKTSAKKPVARIKLQQNIALFILMDKLHELSINQTMISFVAYRCKAVDVVCTGFAKKLN